MWQERGGLLKGKSCCFSFLSVRIACSADVAVLAMGSVSFLGCSHLRLLYLSYTLIILPTFRVTLPTDVSLNRQRYCCVSVLQKMYRQLMACSP